MGFLKQSIRKVILQFDAQGREVNTKKSISENALKI